MKFTFRYSRRHQTYVTLCACAAGLGLMVIRFGLSLEKLLSYLAISVGLLIAIFTVAVCLGWLLKRFRDGSNPVDTFSFDIDDEANDPDNDASRN